MNLKTLIPKIKPLKNKIKGFKKNKEPKIKRGNEKTPWFKKSEIEPIKKSNKKILIVDLNSLNLYRNFNWKIKKIVKRTKKPSSTNFNIGRYKIFAKRGLKITKVINVKNINNF